MEEYKTKRIHYVEVAKDIYAAITPADGLDITDAGMMDNFSNSAYINRGEGLVSDTFFDLPHARELREFCIKKSSHAPKYVINTHGHWDHFWGNQVFEEATIMGHKDMLKDCSGDKNKVPVFKFLHGSRVVQNLIAGIMTGVFKKNLPAGLERPKQPYPNGWVEGIISPYPPLPRSHPSLVSLSFPLLDKPLHRLPHQPEAFG